MKTINQITIRPAENGFTIGITYKDSADYTVFVARTMPEATALIEDFYENTPAAQPVD